MRHIKQRMLEKRHPGIVRRIASHRQSDNAEVVIGRGKNARVIKIEVRRLLAADLAYSGARFYLVVRDVGALRTIRIVPNKKANDSERVKLQHLLKEFVEDSK